jgi:hypothetical protein
MSNYDDDEEGADLILRHSFSAKAKRILEKSGVPHSAFMRANCAVNMDDAVVKIETELPGTKLRKVSTQRQLKNFEKMWDNPLWGSYLFVISSFPTDIRAKHVALSVMAKAMDQFYRKKRDNKNLIKRTPPVWHNVMGGFKDKYLDSDMSMTPSLLILSNVTDDSTQLKCEKLRDILVKYDSIPRIVVTCSSDPLTFMLGQLKHHCDGAVYLSPEDRAISV